MANYLRVDNESLHRCAAKLTHTIRRISSLEAQFSRLYWQTGNLEIWKIMHSDSIYKNRKKLKKCIPALTGTANDWEALEKSIRSGGLRLDGLKSLKMASMDIGWSIGIEKIESIVSSRFSPQFKIKTVLEIYRDYASILGGYAFEKVETFIKSINESDDLRGKIVSVYDWFQDELVSDFKTLSDMRKDLSDYEMPKNVKNSLDILKYGDLLIDNVKKIGEILDGNMDGIDKLMLKNDKELFKIFDKILETEKYEGIAGKTKSVLIDTIFEMPQKWIDGITNFAENGEGTAGSVVFDTTAGAFSTAIAKAAAPYYKAATAGAYPVLDQLCEAFGYDLSAEYEKLTGKTGLDAVFAAQKELWVDIVGGGIRDAVSSGIDKGYELIGNAWDASFGKLFK